MTFADSNVLVYLVAGEDPKARAAKSLLIDGLVISVQVLNEITWVMRRKFGRDWSEIASVLETISPHLDVRAITGETHRAGLILVRRYKLGWWDALIVAAALESGCDTLYSEDMHAGLVVEGRLRVVNPFV